MDFIDSSGISLFVSTFNPLQQRRTQFALCGLIKKNLEIFKITRLDAVLNIYPTEEAVAALQ